ncbi:MAG: diguanylate cyclase [bacterium]|nr:diguanylate cyclase [bacterium]
MTAPAPAAPDAVVAELTALRADVARLRASEAEQREWVEHTNSIVLRWDPEGRIRYLNTHGCELFGFIADELVGRSVIGTIVPETESSGRDLVRMIAELLAHPDRFLANENENCRKDGTRLWITWRNRGLLDADGNLREILSSGIDSTERRRAEEALRASEWRYRVLFQSTPVALLERDVSAFAAWLTSPGATGPEAVVAGLERIRTTDRNAAVLSLLDFDPREHDEPALEAAVTALLRPWAAELATAVASRTMVQLERETELRTLREKPRHVVVRGTLVPGPDAAAGRLILALVDVTERVRTEETLRATATRFRDLAEHDNLTGLYNTRYLYEALEALVRTETRCALIFVDLDRFKRVVDQNGHLNGSRAIQEVAATIRTVLEEPAFGVAYAGDEFVIVLPGGTRDDAVTLAEEVRTRIARTVYLVGQGLRVRLRASFGVAAFPDDAQDVEGLLSCGDRALFDVKRRGRGFVGTAVALLGRGV